MLGFLSVVLYIIFVLVAMLLILVILMQEGKGGGFGQAFGGAGAETFGVRAGGVNKFTGLLFAVFIASAIGIHWLESSQTFEDSVLTFPEQQPEAPDPGMVPTPVEPVPLAPEAPAEPEQ